MRTLSLSNASLTGLDEGATGARRGSLDGVSAIARSIVLSKPCDSLSNLMNSRLQCDRIDRGEKHAMACCRPES